MCAEPKDVRTYRSQGQYTRIPINGVRKTRVMNFRTDGQHFNPRSRDSNGATDLLHFKFLAAARSITHKAYFAEGCHPVDFVSGRFGRHENPLGGLKGDLSVRMAAHGFRI
jgi:hypothetical protein